MKDVQATRKAFSPRREHPALQNINFLHFFSTFMNLFALTDFGSAFLDPNLDPADQINTDPSGAESTKPGIMNFFQL
jgi:hypothetical protein